MCRIQVNQLSVKAGGPAGKGVFTIGALLSKTLHRLGLWVVVTKDYPSLIKGGHNTITIRAEPEPIYSDIELVDLLIAVDAETVQKHYLELSPHGAIIADNVALKGIGQVPREDIHHYDLPVAEIIAKAGGPRYENTVLYAAACAALAIPQDISLALIRESFAKKGPVMVENNTTAFTLGYAAMESLLVQRPFPISVEPIEHDGRRIFISGNDAASIGAIKAGVKLVAEYPMTPSSSVLHFMAAHEESKRILVKHTEDELAAMNMLIGGSVAGLRSMTATSGGGFALMNEALGFAALAEAPVVILECMRSGPSTGMPTYTDQGDLLYAIHASQGEFPRIVFTPGDPEEAFYQTFHAHNLAEQLQIPVIVLLDKHVADTVWSVPRFPTAHLRVDRGWLLRDEDVTNYLDENGKFKRHMITQSGISPRAIPGQPYGMHVASSYEHDETGYTSEEIDMRNAQMEKRFRKMASLSPEYTLPTFYGASAKDADLLVISWGSNKGAIREALTFTEKEGKKVRYMHITCAWPLDTETIERELSMAKTSLLVEGTFTGQMGQLIRRETGIKIPHSYLKYDGRPFTPWALRCRFMEVIR